MDREIKAANAYLKLLQNKGAKSAFLYKRSLFLDRFKPLLAELPSTRESYSRALGGLIKDLPAEDGQETILIAREFYPFWIDDIKAIAAFSLHGGFDVESLAWKPEHTHLKSLMESLKKSVFDDAENNMLNAYTQSLAARGAESIQIETYIKLAKLLLIQLKGAPAEDLQIYRAAVDATVLLFEMDDARHLFVTVIRDFYPFWERIKSNT